MSSARNPAELA